MDYVPPPNQPPPPPTPPPPGQPPYPGQGPYAGQPPYSGQPPQTRSWWSRNWLWFVPTGCVSLLVLLALFVGGIVFFVFGVMKSSDVYKEAVARAKSSEQVKEALGTPVEEGMVLSGSINTNNSMGDARLEIPISGPKGEGKIYVRASKSGGDWNYSQMDVKVAGSGETIDLLQSSP